MKRYIVCVVVGFFSFVLSLAAQTPSTGLTSAQVPPPLIQFSNVATDEGGNTMSGVVNISFSLYNSQQGGEPLWTETQNSIPLDPTGHYSVQLGITKPSGVPTTLFTTGEARWLGVQIAEQAEQPRVLLVSVPYALKAGDAETVGGLPPSAFVLAAPQNGAASAYTTASAARQSVSPATATDVTTTGGKANYLPVFNGASTIVDSLASQSGGAINLPKLALQNTNAGGTQGVIEFGGVPFIHNYLSLEGSPETSRTPAFTLPPSGTTRSPPTPVVPTIRRLATTQVQPIPLARTIPSSAIRLTLGQIISLTPPRLGPTRR
jgi:hypothetical protein